MRNSGCRSPRVTRSSRTVRQASAHSTRVGAGEVTARYQRVGRQRAPLIGPQCRAAPLGGVPIGGVQSGARHRDLDRPERTGQRPRPASVAMPCDTRSFFIAGRLASPITRSGQGLIYFAADQFFDELPSSTADFERDRLRPIAKKVGNRLCLKLPVILL